jgi:hypothetical protein
MRAVILPKPTTSAKMTVASSKWSAMIAQARCDPSRQNVAQEVLAMPLLVLYLAQILAL